MEITYLIGILVTFGILESRNDVVLGTFETVLCILLWPVTITVLVAGTLLNIKKEV